MHLVGAYRDILLAACSTDVAWPSAHAPVNAASSICARIASIVRACRARFDRREVYIAVFIDAIDYSEQTSRLERSLLGRREMRKSLK